MTTQNAGRINPDWLSDARANEHGDETVEAWFVRALNVKSVEIDEEGSIWIEGAQQGGWLSQSEIDETCKQIDAGV
jgi:hypothetical protein